MGSIADLYVAVRAQMDGFEKEIVAGAQVSGAKAGAAAGDSVNKSLAAKIKGRLNKNLLGEVASGLGFMGPVGLAVGGIGTLINVLGDAGRAASDLSETESKLTQVFPAQAEEITKWAQKSAEAMGLSSKEALEAVGTFGNFLQAMGQGPDVAADMSRAMVQLASDLGSFNNQDPTQVLGALQSGLSGETEPLRRFGVDISDAAVQAELLATGVEKVGKGFTQAQKIQGRYALIMKQTAKAQGDYARTATGTANATRTAAAAQENLRAKMGFVVNGVQNVIQVMLGNGANALVGVLETVGDAWTNLTKILERTPASTGDTAISMASDDIISAAAALNATADAQALVPEKVDAAAEEWQHFADAMWDATDANIEFQNDAKTGVLQNLEWTARSAGVGLADVLELYDLLAGQGMKAEQIQKSIMDTLMSTDQLAIQLGKDRKATDAEVTARMKDQFLSREQAIEQIRTELREHRFVTHALSSEADAAAAVAAARTERAKAIAKEQAEYTEALQGFESSVDVTVEHLKNKKTKKWEWVKQVTHHLTELKTKFRNDLATIDWMMAHPGGAKKTRNELVNQLNRLEKRKDKVLLSGDWETFAAIEQDIADVQTQLADLDGDQATITIRMKKLGFLKGQEDALGESGGAPGRPPEKAEGGPVYGNRPYLIGERGPEMFVPSTSGTIVPNHALNAQGGRLDVFVHDRDGGLARGGIGTFALAAAIATQAQSVRRWED